MRPPGRPKGAYRSAQHEGDPSERFPAAHADLGPAVLAVRAVGCAPRPDLGALAEAEGIALRPGPRPAIAPALFATLRGAVKACRKVSFSYAGRASGTTATRTVRPLGFLYGHRHYLVAINDADPAAMVRFHSLPQISRLRLTGDSFVRDPGFDLRAFVAPSFGVFEEAPVNVVWRFTAAAAAIARQFQFHASQTSESDAEGRLVVRFHAGGLLEMAWHLMSWGDAVEVLEPAALRDLLPANDPPGRRCPDWNHDHVPE